MGTMDLSGADVTIEAWVNPSQFPNTIHTIAGIERSGEAAALLRLGDVGLAPNKPQFVLHIGDGQVKLNAESGLETGEWQHVAAIFNGSHMRLYVDGQLDAQRRYTGRVSARGIFRVGKSFGGRYFYGKMDEVRVWDSGLAGQYVRKFGNQEISGNTSSLIAYWPFNKGRGSTVVDLARAQGRQTGTIQGASWTSPGAPLGGGASSETTGGVRQNGTDGPSDEGFELHFSQLRLKYSPTDKGASMALCLTSCRRNSFSLTGYRLRRVRDHIIHFRGAGWQGFFWRINFSQGEVYQVRGASIGDLGGRAEPLDIEVTDSQTIGGRKFTLRFPATFSYNADGNAFQITYQTPSRQLISLSQGDGWEGERRGPHRFQIRHQYWRDLHWTVDTSTGTVRSVRGGTEQVLGIEATAIGR